MLEVISSSSLHSIQDLGRFGHSRFGLATAGAMDLHASSWANKLLNNTAETAFIELTLGGFSCRFLETKAFVLTGGQCDVQLNGQPIDLWTVYIAEPGSTLTVKAMHSGVFNYLAVHGGFDVQHFLGSPAASRRDQIGGIDAQAGPFKPGMIIKWKTSTKPIERNSVPTKYIPDYNAPLICDVMLREHNQLSDVTKRQFLDDSYTVSNETSRVGYRLDGCPLQISVPRYSSPIPLGGVQITAAGQPIVLMRDHQTLGGYPLIASVTRRSLSMLAQRRAGQMLRFKQVSINDAQKELVLLNKFFGSFK
ncbi:MAG: biotin-dependent carboxyltransferase family protein [Gammaproteobacteria bacterium]|nr:biotin-dependent carboxyltransferase family protein [Gammaproteobacteria bacterium]